MASKAPGWGSADREQAEGGLSQPCHGLSDPGELLTSHGLGMATTELSGMEVQAVRDRNEGKNTPQGFEIIARTLRQATKGKPSIPTFNVGTEKFMTATSCRIPN